MEADLIVGAAFRLSKDKECREVGEDLSREAASETAFRVLHIEHLNFVVFSYVQRAQVQDSTSGFFDNTAIAFSILTFFLDRSILPLFDACVLAAFAGILKKLRFEQKK